MIAMVPDETFSAALRLMGQEGDMDAGNRDTHGPVEPLPALKAGVLSVLLLLGATGLSAAAMHPAPDPKLAAKIDAYIRPFVEGNNFPGAILVARGDDVLFSKAYGMANYELNVPNSPRQRFHLASLTKMFTAAAVLLLEEQGKLSTSDTVAKFLPDYPNGGKILLEQSARPHRRRPQRGFLRRGRPRPLHDRAAPRQIQDQAPRLRARIEDPLQQLQLQPPGLHRREGHPGRATGITSGPTSSTASG